MNELGENELGEDGLGESGWDDEDLTNKEMSDTFRYTEDYDKLEKYSNERIKSLYNNYLKKFFEIYGQNIDYEDISLEAIQKHKEEYINFYRKNTNSSSSIEAHFNTLELLYYRKQTLLSIIENNLWKNPKKIQKLIQKKLFEINECMKTETEILMPRSEKLWWLSDDFLNEALNMLKKIQKEFTYEWVIIKMILPRDKIFSLFSEFPTFYWEQEVLYKIRNKLINKQLFEVEQKEQNYFSIYSSWKEEPNIRNELFSSKNEYYTGIYSIFFKNTNIKPNPNNPIYEIKDYKGRIPPTADMILFIDKLKGLGFLPFLITNEFEDKKILDPILLVPKTINGEPIFFEIDRYSI